VAWYIEILAPQFGISNWLSTSAAMNTPSHYLEMILDDVHEVEPNLDDMVVHVEAADEAGDTFMTQAVALTEPVAGVADVVVPGTLTSDQQVPAIDLELLWRDSRVVFCKPATCVGNSRLPSPPKAPQCHDVCHNVHFRIWMRRLDRNRHGEHACLRAQVNCRRDDHAVSTDHLTPTSPMEIPRAVVGPVRHQVVPGRGPTRISVQGRNGGGDGGGDGGSMGR